MDHWGNNSERQQESITGEITEAKDLEEVPVAIVGVSIVDVTVKKSAQDLLF